MNTLKIAADCKHRGGDLPRGWCRECVKALVRDVSLFSAKNGTGVPPIEKGIWFIKSKHIQNPEHPAGYWGVYHLGSIEDWHWSEEIEEYFGPIPLLVWDQKKKEEPETLQLLLSKIYDNQTLRNSGLLLRFLEQVRDEIIELKNK